MALSFRKPTKMFVVISTFLLAWHGAAAASYVVPMNPLPVFTGSSAEFAMFGMAVVSGLVAATLLLLRSRYAIPVFGLSLSASLLCGLSHLIAGGAWSSLDAILVAGTLALAFAALRYSQHHLRLGLLR